jgi:hypothetical protein
MLVGLFFSEQHTTILASKTALGISEKYFAESASFTCDLDFPLHAIWIAQQMFSTTQCEQDLLFHAIWIC